MMHILCDWTEFLDSEGQVDCTCVYMDFEKD